MFCSAHTVVVWNGLCRKQFPDKPVTEILSFYSNITIAMGFNFPNGDAGDRLASSEVSQSSEKPCTPCNIEFSLCIRV